jgi:hypothetical protein
MPRYQIHLIASVVLLLPLVASGQSVPPPTGEGPIIGLYTAEVMGDDTYAAIVSDGTPFTVHAILSYPDVDAIGAIECRFAYTEDAALYLINAWSSNLAWEWGWSWPNIWLGWPTPQPVTDGHVWLFGMELVKPLIHPVDLYLRPTEPATIPGQMGFLAWDELDARTMRPNSADLSSDQPVFFIDPVGTAIGTRSLSAIKALFR